jgi:hypothetical protein
MRTLARLRGLKPLFHDVGKAIQTASILVVDSGTSKTKNLA